MERESIIEGRFRQFICRDYLQQQKTGRTNTKAKTEKISPEIVPTAKSNQNTSDGPSNKNGINPRIVEIIVSAIGLIFVLNDLT